MGQGDVVDVLQKNRGKWMTTKEVGEECGTNHCTVAMALRKVYQREAKIYNLSRRKDPEYSALRYQWRID